MYSYKGFTYSPYNDHEDDNTKIFHEIKTPDNSSVMMDFSPYRQLSEDYFKMYIDLNLPPRQSNGPLHPQDLDEMYKNFKIAQEAISFCEYIVSANGDAHSENAMKNIKELIANHKFHEAKEASFEIVRFVENNFEPELGRATVVKMNKI